jgi:hypothetical protein
VERAIVGYVLRKTCFFNTLEKGALRKKSNRRQESEMHVLQRVSDYCNVRCE